MTTVAVVAETAAYRPQAVMLAEQLGIPFQEPPHKAELLLMVTATGLELHSVDRRPGMTFRVDFAAGGVAYRSAHLQRANEALARAVLGRRGPRVILDTTAGFGRDAFILACLGCQVTLLERSPVVAALLQDGLRRGREDPRTVAACERMHLARADAHQWLCDYPERWPGSIYLDPMYPATTSSALAGKEMQLLQRLLGGDPDAAQLLQLSLTKAAGRVVIKRPRRAPILGERVPDQQLSGRSTRFDIYLPHA